MSPTIAGKRVFQWGRESTAGTAVAATSKMIIEEFDLEPSDALFRPQYLNGVSLEHTGNEFVNTRGTRWTARGVLTYEQAMHWLHLAIQGGVNPTGGGPYTWVYTRNATQIPAPGSMTIERRLDDGSSQIDNEWAYVQLTELTLKAEPEDMVRIEASGFARRVQGSTLTPALALPTAELIPHGSTSLFIDTTFAGVGTTQITSQLLGWELKLRPSGIVTLPTADGRADLDFPAVGYDGSLAGLDFKATLLLNTTRYATEKTAAEAATLRACQLKMTGTSPRDIEIDFLAKHEQGSLFKVGAYRGQDVYDLALTTASDGTNFLRATVINSVAAFA